MSPVANIRRSVEEFRAVIAPLPRTMLHRSDEEHYEFLQREIVPRRFDLYGTLLSLQAADQQRLQESEREFSDARPHAARRLLIILGLCLLLAGAVARFSLRHAENLEQQAEKHYAEVELAKVRLLGLRQADERRVLGGKLLRLIDP